MFGLEIASFLAVCLIFIIGGTVKGILGFGLPLITMSLLPFVISIEAAIAMSALVQPATNIGQIIQSGGFKKALKDTTPVLLTLAPGIAIGTYLLSKLDSNIITTLAGVMVIAFALYNLSGLKFFIPQEIRRHVGLGAGLVAGISGGLTSINGFLFIMYLVGIDQDRQSFRSSIAVLFIVSGAMVSSGLWAVGIVNLDIFMLAMFALLPAAIGMWAGNIFGKKISNEKFRKIVLFGLLIIGAVFIVRAISGG